MSRQRRYKTLAAASIPFFFLFFCLPFHETRNQIGQRPACLPMKIIVLATFLATRLMSCRKKIKKIKKNNSPPPPCRFLRQLMLTLFCLTRKIVVHTYGGTADWVAPYQFGPGELLLLFETTCSGRKTNWPPPRPLIAVMWRHVSGVVLGCLVIALLPAPPYPPALASRVEPGPHTLPPGESPSVPENTLQGDLTTQIWRV